MSCPSSEDCVAVGFYADASSSLHGVILTQSDGVWKSEETQLPGDAALDPGVQLNAVTCVSVGNCTAVGSYDSSSGAILPLTVAEVDGIWSAGDTPKLPADAGSAPGSAAAITGIACVPQSTSCTAVGFYTDLGGAQQGLILTEDGGRWAPPLAAMLPANADTTGHANLNVVACASSGSCTAAGTFTDETGHGLPFVVRLNGTAG